MGMVVNFPQPILAKELAAVMINLSHNAKNVEQMISNRGLNYLMDRLENNKDSLLLKIIQNISVWTYNQQKVSSINHSFFHSFIDLIFIANFEVFF